MPEKSILLVEDDTELCALMTDYFSQHEFKLEAVHDGRRGLSRALEGNFDDCAGGDIDADYISTGRRFMHKFPTVLGR